VQSYRSWITELNRKYSDGVDRRRYAYEHLGAGEALALVRERTDSRSDRAVSYYHRAVHLGYVPKKHHWIAEALDDGLRLAVIVEKVKLGWFVRRRANLLERASSFSTTAANVAHLVGIPWQSRIYCRPRMGLGAKDTQAAAPLFLLHTRPLLI
jgi:hypothetical protein